MFRRSLGELTFYIYCNEVIASLFKREFQIFFLWGFKKCFMLEDIVNIRNECLIGFAVHGICHVPRPSSFPMNAEIRHSFLKKQLLTELSSYTDKQGSAWLKTAQHRTDWQKINRRNVSFIPIQGGIYFSCKPALLDVQELSLVRQSPTKATRTFSDACGRWFKYWHFVIFKTYLWQALRSVKMKSCKVKG